MSGSQVGRCSRCNQKKIKDFMAPREAEFTAGYYDVTPGSGWEKFANPDEVHVCDNCMWADPRYTAVYGNRSSSDQADGAQ